MKELSEVLIALFGFIGLVLSVIIFCAFLGPVMGYISGWIVSIFFEEIFHGVMIDLGFPPIRLPHLGAFPGFVGGFFRNISGAAK